MPAGVWQYNIAIDVARIFHMRVDFAGLASPATTSTHPVGVPGQLTTFDLTGRAPRASPSGCTPVTGDSSRVTRQPSR